MTIHDMNFWARDDMRLLCYFFYMDINLIIFYWLYGFAHQSNRLDGAITYIAKQGDMIVFGLVVVFFLYLFFLHHSWKQRGWAAWVAESFFVGVSVVVAWALSYVIKILVAAPRPFMVDPQLQPLFIHGGYDSFPSGHATVFFALAVIIYDYHKTAGYFFIICAALIALCRVMSGIHYPIDILIGAIIGIVIGKMVYHWSQKILKK